MTRKLSVNIPAPEGSVFGPDVAEGFVGQHFHLLINGQAYLAIVESAQNLGPETINIVGVVEDPQEEPVPVPMELTAADMALLDPPVLADDDCLRMTPEAECPAAGSPRCMDCVWRPAEEGSDG